MSLIISTCDIGDRRSFKGQCNIDGYYVDAISVLFIVRTKTCYWRSKHWNLLRVIQVVAKETWFQSVTDMTKYFSPGGQLGWSGAAALGSAAQVAEKFAAK